MMEKITLRNDISEFISNIPRDITIVAATKYVDYKQMINLYNNGIVNFGENRVDSFIEKYDHLKDYNVLWHFIGHLQRNKCDKIINKIDYLHSLDSLLLAQMISKKREKPLKVFIEININDETNKSGIKPTDVLNFVSRVISLPNIEVIGFMTMTKKNSTCEEQKTTFKKLHSILDETNKKLGTNMKELSMGMSDDYKEAILEGATFVRLGRILWNM